MRGGQVRDKGRNGRNDLAEEIKISKGVWENNSSVFQFNPAGQETLLFIFLFMATRTFLSPLYWPDSVRPLLSTLEEEACSFFPHHMKSTARQGSVFFSVRVPDYCDRKTKVWPTAAAFVHSSVGRSSLLHGPMTNTSYCHRTVSVRDEHRHCPLRRVSQLLSSVAN